MPTDLQIRDGIFDNATLEVAKKFKTLFTKMQASLPAGTKPPTDKEYLVMAAQAIKDRKITFPGDSGKAIKEMNGSETVELSTLDELMDEQQKKDLGGKPSDLVPLTEDLEEVARVAQRSVKKAQGPFSIMGASIFTLISALFEALGDLFAGKIEGGIGGFFSHVKKIAAERTGEEASESFETGLTALSRQNPRIGAWLTPDAISAAGAGMRDQARVAGGAPAGKNAEQQLAELNPGSHYTSLVTGHAHGMIRDSVGKDMLDVVKGAVGVDGKPSIIGMGKALLGFAPRPEDAVKFTDTVSATIARVTTDPAYKYNGKNERLIAELKIKKPGQLSTEDMQVLLKEEVGNDLRTLKPGFFSFTLSNEHITAIADKVPEYVTKNETMLRELSKRVTDSTRPPLAPGGPVPVPAGPGAGPVTPIVPGGTGTSAPDGAGTPAPGTPAPSTTVDYAKVKIALETTFDGTKDEMLKGMQAQAAKGVVIAADDPFFAATREQFVKKGLEVAKERPELLQPGQQAAFAQAITDKMMADTAFREVAGAKLRQIKPVLDNPSKINFALKKLAETTAPQLTVALNNPTVVAAFASAITTTTPIAAAPSIPAAPVPGGAAPGTAPASPPVAGTPPLPAPPVGPSGTPGAGSGSTPSAPPVELSAQDLIDLFKGEIEIKMNETLADKKPDGTSNPSAEIFNKMTGLNKTPPADRGAARATIIAPFANSIATSGIVVTSDNPGGLFVLDADAGKLKFKDEAVLTSPEKAFEVFAEAKKRITAKLRADNPAATPETLKLYDSMAENTAMQTVNKALEDAEKPRLNIKTDPRLAVAQTEMARTYLTAEIEDGFKKDPSTNMLGLGVGGGADRMKLIASKAAAALAPLLVVENTDPAALKDAIDKALSTGEGAITDKDKRALVVDGISKSLIERMKGPKSPEQEAQDKIRNLDEATRIVRDKIGKDADAAFAPLKDIMKAEIKAGDIWLDPSKMYWPASAAARRFKPQADAFVDNKVDQEVDAYYNRINRTALKKVFSDAAVEAAQATYDGRQFFELSDEEKKQTVADRVSAKLNDGKTFEGIFPNPKITIGSIGSFNIGTVDYEMAGQKQKIIGMLTQKVKDSMNFAAATPDVDPTHADPLAPLLTPDVRAGLGAVRTA